MPTSAKVTRCCMGDDIAIGQHQPAPVPSGTTMYYGVTTVIIRLKQWKTRCRGASLALLAPRATDSHALGCGEDKRPQCTLPVAKLPISSAKTLHPVCDLEKPQQKPTGRPCFSQKAMAELPGEARRAGGPGERRGAWVACCPSGEENTTARSMWQTSDSNISWPFTSGCRSGCNHAFPRTADCSYCNTQQRKQLPGLEA